MSLSNSSPNDKKTVHSMNKLDEKIWAQMNPVPLSQNKERSKIRDQHNKSKDRLRS